MTHNIRMVRRNGAAMSRTTFFVSLGLLSALGVSLQFLGFPQIITGMLVNAVLFTAAEWTGPLGGAWVGCATPLAALLLGRLPAPLWPLVPFIGAGNILLIVAFWLVQRAGPGSHGRIRLWISVAAASAVKFLFLLLSVKTVLPFLAGAGFPSSAAAVVAAPQFFTAMGGGGLFIMIRLALGNALLDRRKQ
jgi:hypothetical protein